MYFLVVSNQHPKFAVILLAMFPFMVYDTYIEKIGIGHQRRLRMRKWLFVALCVAVMATIGVLVSCTSDEAAYYVRFKADGQDYELTKGFSDIASGDAVAVISGEEYLALTGTTDNIDTSAIGDDETEVENAVFIVLVGTTTGTYDEEGEIELVFVILDSVEYEIGALSVTITVVNEVGSTVEGTFTATVTPEGGGDSVEITEGEFKLYRAEDDVISPPPD